MGIHVNWKHTLETSFEFGNINCILETHIGYWKHNLYIGNIRIRLETESVYWKHNFSLENTLCIFFWMTCRQFIYRLGNSFMVTVMLVTSFFDD